MTTPRHPNLRHRCRRGRCAPLLLAFAALLALPAQAVAQETWSGLRAMGMADAFVGGGSGPSAIFHNPAGVGIAPLYAAEIGYRHDLAPDLHTLGFSLADGSTNPNFGGALAYTVTLGDGRIGDDGLHGTRNHDVRAAISLPIIPQQVSFGFGARYLNHALGTQEPLAANRLRSRGFTFDLGILAAIIPEFAVGASFLNLGGPDSAQLPRTLRLGTGLFFGPIHVEVDYGLDFDSDPERTSNVFAVGTELTFADNVPVRAGYRREMLTERNLVSAGLGYRYPAGGIDAAVIVNPSGDRDVAFALSLLGYF